MSFHLVFLFAGKIRQSVDSLINKLLILWIYNAVKQTKIKIG